MKIAEIREKSVDQLYKELSNTREKLRETRFKSVYREVADKTMKSKLRHQIARILTVIREKEVAAITNQK